MSTTPPLESQVIQLHDCYCKFLDWKMPLSLGIRTQWERYIHEGFTLPDLQMVLKRASFQIAKGIDSGVLRFSRIIGDTARFAEDLALAKAEQRIKREGPTPRDKALGDLRPIVVESRTNGVEAKAAREVALRAIDNMRKELNGN